MRSKPAHPIELPHMNSFTNSNLRFFPRITLMLLSSGPPLLRRHATTRSSRQKMIWTISCVPCSTQKASALQLLTQLPPERVSRYVSPSYKRHAESPSPLNRESQGTSTSKSSRAELIRLSELCA